MATNGLRIRVQGDKIYKNHPVDIAEQKKSFILLDCVTQACPGICSHEQPRVALRSQRHRARPKSEWSSWWGESVNAPLSPLVYGCRSCLRSQPSAAALRGQEQKLDRPGVTRRQFARHTRLRYRDDLGLFPGVREVKNVIDLADDSIRRVLQHEHRHSLSAGGFPGGHLFYVIENLIGGD